MRKIFIPCACLLLVLLSHYSKKTITASESNKIEESKKEDIIRIEPESKTIKVNPWKNDSTILTLKYKTSGMKYKHEFYSASYPESNLLLNEVLYFYEDENGEHYLGKVCKTGVYDSKDNPLFLTRDVYCLREDAYVSDILLKYPSHVDYLWFDCDKDNDKDNIQKLHVTFEPVINLDFDLENMTIKKLIPNI